MSIVSIASDYNGDSYSDAALYNRATISFTGTLTSGSPLLTGLSSLTGLVTGVTVTGTGIPSGTTIKSVTTTTITLSGQTQDGERRPQSLTANPGLWIVENTSVGPANPAPFWFTSGTAFGPSDVTPFQGDFDGDGLTDLAYYQSSTATWNIENSQNKTITTFTLGTPNLSVPVVGYFNANGPEEVAVFTIVNGQGVWTIANGSTVTFGQTGDIPAPGDYTGIGYDELAVYRPSTGQFLVLVPGAGGTTTTDTISIPGIGVGTTDLSSLVPVPKGNYNPYNTSLHHGGLGRDTPRRPSIDPNTGVYTILGAHCVPILRSIGSILETSRHQRITSATDRPSQQCSAPVTGISTRSSGVHRQSSPRSVVVRRLIFPWLLHCRIERLRCRIH